MTHKCILALRQKLGVPSYTLLYKLKSMLLCSLQATVHCGKFILLSPIYLMTYFKGLTPDPRSEPQVHLLSTLLGLVNLRKGCYPYERENSLLLRAIPGKLGEMLQGCILCGTTNNECLNFLIFKAKTEIVRSIKLDMNIYHFKLGM